MLGVIITFLIAIVGLSLLFALVLTRDETPCHSAPQQAHPPVAGVTAVFLRFEVLDGKNDYEKLGTRLELRPIRKAFWRDRRRIVLMWLGELRNDVHVLWKFRRFLASNGLSVTFREEIGLLFAVLLALVHLKFLRAIAFIFGPFVFCGGFARAGAWVESLAHLVVAPLDRVPAPKKAEIERGWVQQHFAAGMKAG